MKKNIRDKARALKIETRAFIGGYYVDAISSGIIEKISSADGLSIPAICSCQSEDIDIAVDIAQKSFNSRSWQNKLPQEKKEILFKLANLMEENKEELALLDTLETGRAFKNYYYDSLPKAISALRYFAESIDKYYDHAIPSRPHAFATITKEPLGVVGLITPWNDPMVTSIWKLAPALLMGNSVVIKPAEQSSYSILSVAKLAKQAGIPDGVLNVVPGYGETAGRALALHDNVNGIFFTGSSKTGKKILKYAGESNMKKVGLECGGKSPFIVTKNYTNHQRAAEVLAKNIFYNQGQICSASSRLIIDNDIKYEFIEYLKIEMYKYIPADPFNIDSEVGCVISEEQKEKIKGYIEHGKKLCTKMYTPVIENDLVPNGSYIVPIIFDIANPQSMIAQEEIFGPVLVVIGVSSIREAVAVANNSKYGLAASVWSNDLDEAYYISRKLDAGIVHVNCYGDDDNTVPFGGIKESGIGKDKSIYAFDEYSYTKTTWIHFESLG